MPKVRQLTTLQKIEAKIAACREIIANNQAEIRQLESAIAVFRRVEGSPAGESFAGKKIRECAQILLEEQSPRMFKDIAREAFARGYVSQKGGDIDIVSRSFLSVMNMCSNVFEKVGPGKFRLKKKEEG